MRNESDGWAAGCGVPKRPEKVGKYGRKFTHWGPGTPLDSLTLFPQITGLSFLTRPRQGGACPGAWRPLLACLCWLAEACRCAGGKPSGVAGICMYTCTRTLGVRRCSLNRTILRDIKIRARNSIITWQRTIRGRPDGNQLYRATRRKEWDSFGAMEKKRSHNGPSRRFSQRPHLPNGMGWSIDHLAPGHRPSIPKPQRHRPYSLRPHFC